MALDPRLAEAALRSGLADQIKMEPLESAAGVYDVVNEMMATAAGVYIAERGQDPRRFTLVATGGAGPIHAVEVARKLGIAKVIVPPAAGVASAGGLLVAPPRLDFARSLPVQLDILDWPAIEKLFAAMEAEALATLERMGVAPDSITIERGVDARYVNQGHEIPVPLPASINASNARARLATAFDDTYRQLFGRTVAGVPVECITWRTSIRGRDGTLPAASVAGQPDALPHAVRAVYFRSSAGAVDTPVFRRETLGTNRRFEGPAIIEEAQSTTVIGPADAFHIDRSGNVVIQVGTGGSR